jgi:hypothetical protein
MIRYLWGANFAPLAGFGEPQMRTPVLAVALMLTAIAILAFFAVLFRYA